MELEKGQTHGKGIIAKLKGIDDRDAAAIAKLLLQSEADGEEVVVGRILQQTWKDVHVVAHIDEEQA